MGFSPDGKYLATSGMSKYRELVPCGGLPSPDIDTSVPPPPPGVDRHIIIWDLGSASQVCELKGHRDTVYQLAFSRDGTILASGEGDNCVKLWDASNFEEAAKSIDSSKW